MMEKLAESERRESEPLDTMKVRGRLRGVWLALWLAGAAGCVLVGLDGDHAWWLPLFLFLAAASVVVAARSFGRGLDADGNGVVVRNMLRARPIPWRELAAIEFKGVDSEAMQNMYYELVFQRHDGTRVTAEAPGGGIEPGEYLFELRERLVAMRDAALGHHHAPADRPSDAGSTDAEAALESVSEEPAGDWATYPSQYQGDAGEPAGDWATYPSQDQGDAGEELLPAPARRRVKRWGGVGQRGGGVSDHLCPAPRPRVTAR